MKNLCIFTNLKPERLFSLCFFFLRFVVEYVNSQLTWMKFEEQKFFSFGLLFYFGFFVCLRSSSCNVNIALLFNTTRTVKAAVEMLLGKQAQCFVTWD